MTGIWKKIRDYISNENVDCSWTFAVIVCVARFLVTSGTSTGKIFWRGRLIKFSKLGYGCWSSKGVFEILLVLISAQIFQSMDIGGSDYITAFIEILKTNQCFDVSWFAPPKFWMVSRQSPDRLPLSMASFSAGDIGVLWVNALKTSIQVNQSNALLDRPPVE